MRRLARFPGTRSAREVALAAMVATRLLLGWLVAFPSIATAGALGVGALEHGDRALFAGGGLHLLELLGRGSAAWLATAQTTLLALSVALVVQSLPVAYVFVAFAAGEREPLVGFQRALRAAPRFVILGLVELAGSGLSLLLGGFAVTLGFESWAAPGPATLAVVGLSLVLLGVVAVVCDLARAVMVCGEPSFARALGAWLETRWRARFELAAGYVLAFGAGAFALSLGARAAELCAVERAGALRVLAVFLVHLAVLASLAMIQAAWARRLGRYATPLSPRA